MHRAPKKHVMPFHFEGEEKRHGDGGRLDHEILSEYLAEYKSQPRAFKENLTLPRFIQLKKERRPCRNIFLLPTFDGSSTCTARSWKMKLDAFFLLNLVVEREVVEIVALHLEGKEKIWWFSHLSHARVTAYADFTQRLIKKFDKNKSEENRPSPPLVARPLASGERTLASLQDGLDLLTFRVPCIIQEMHEEEDTYTNTGAVVEEQP